MTSAALPTRAAPGAVLGCALAAAALACAPGVALAADLTMEGTCFASGQPVVISGAAFTPGTPVTIEGAATGGAQADTAGRFTTEVAAPRIPQLGPARVTLTAVDHVNPANTARLELMVVREAFGSNLPLAGGPRETTTWRFAGFAPDRPVYAHFLLRGRERGSYRFGVARGSCGTLTVRARRIPGVLAVGPGKWTLKLDQRMSYRETEPGSEASFRILRR